MVVQARRCSRICIDEDFEKGITEKHVVVLQHTGVVASKCVTLQVVQRQTLVSIRHAIIDILLGCRALYFCKSTSWTWLYIDNTQA